MKWNEAKNKLSGISGFHHDFMGALENSGLLTFVKKGVEKNGCYLADIEHPINQEVLDEVAIIDGIYNVRVI